MKNKLLVLVLTLFVVAICTSLVTAQDAVSYFPTEGWRTSSPEAQGMSSAELAAFYQTWSREFLNLDSLMVIKNGYVVAEAYVPPFEQDMKHYIASASKSVIGALIGILLRDGYLDSLDTPVLSLFPDRIFQNVDANKEAMTVRNLLTLSSGLACDDLDPAYTERPNMLKSEDWLQYALDLPMASVPGTEFHYCNPATTILSAIITEKTGMSALDFAAQELFAPLGITDYGWESSPLGISMGFSGLELTTRDMAKLGYLYLHGGEWDGEQIIPADYMEAALSPQAETLWQDWPYGYQLWYVRSLNTPEAIGYGGQYIHLDPARDLVVIMTQVMAETLRSNFYEGQFLNDITALSVSETPLPEHAQGLRELEETISAIENPVPASVETMPAIAAEVTGQSYTLFSPIVIGVRGSIGEVKTINAESLRFDFNSDTQADVTFSFEGGDKWTVPVNLDGIYQMSDELSALGPTAFKGEWQTENIFRVSMKCVGDIGLLNFDVTFLPDSILVVASEYASGSSYVTQGVVQAE